MTAIGMATGVLVEALLLDSGGAAVQGKPMPKNEKDAKEWLRNKIEALALLPGKSGVKAAEALPAIIGTLGETKRGYSRINKTQ